MVEFIKKISKVGDSYAVFIPKALVDSKVLERNKHYKFQVMGTYPILAIVFLLDRLKIAKLILARVTKKLTLFFPFTNHIFKRA